MRWLNSKEVLAIHSRQIAEHGGRDGVRDHGLLESALVRPQNVHSYEPDADIATLAATYAFGIVKNHPFIDGNKPTALVAMRTFLILNGKTVSATPGDKYFAIFDLATGNLFEQHLAEWIRQRLRK
jgi:death-on-curing protein